MRLIKTRLSVLLGALMLMMCPLASEVRAEGDPLRNLLAPISASQNDSCCLSVVYVKIPGDGKGLPEVI